MAAPGSDFREDETCRQFVVPALIRAGWDDEQICDNYTITAGPIQATTRRHRRGRPLFADYALEYTPGLPIAVVEAKRTRLDAMDGFQQAKRYAIRLDVPFAYATNGREIFEVDLSTGSAFEVPAFPSPAELWARYQSAKGIADGLQSELVTAPFNHELRNLNNSPKRPRYYQREAVNRVVNAIARGDKRILVVLATGTGKTLVAFQIVAKLWGSSWTPGREPRVLYLADRNILIDQPKDDYFAPVFRDAVYKLGGGVAKRGRNIYLALYQSIERGDEQDEQALFEEFPADHFDLIIVDECHRGSARDESRWRRILEHFSPATQLGMTATPISNRDADTYRYFGNPIYTYSLAQGIEDGYLAPYRVRKIRLNVDLIGYQPEPGEKDLYGREIPEGLYGPREYERVLTILDRTEEAARYLTEYLHRTGRMGKTIVFCENNNHAGRMLLALHNANSDMMRRYPDYACLITASQGPHDRVLLDDFKRVDTDEPIIAVTSRLLTTGVDMPTVRNIVIFRRIASMPEFKQIIGRGTRLFIGGGDPAADKLTFDILDFVEATRLFRDPEFDGPPIRVVREETDDTGHLVDSEDVPTEGEQEESGEQVAEPAPDYDVQEGGELPPPGATGDQVTDPDQVDEITANARQRYYVDGVEVVVWNESRYIVEGDGRRLVLVEYRDYVGTQVRKLDLSADDLRRGGPRP